MQRILKWWNSFRKKHWPTEEEEHARGIAFAKDTISSLGQAKGIDYLWEVSRDHNDPFDKAIIEYVNELMSRQKWSN